MKCRLPGPHDPAQAVRFRVSIASAPAANPATSSCRTWTHSMALRRMASVTKLSVSPGTPQHRFTPAACRVSTMTSATLLAISGSPRYSVEDQFAGGYSALRDGNPHLTGTDALTA